VRCINAFVKDGSTAEQYRERTNFAVEAFSYCAAQIGDKWMTHALGPSLDKVWGLARTPSSGSQTAIINPRAE